MHVPEDADLHSLVKCLKFTRTSYEWNLCMPILLKLFSPRLALRRPRTESWTESHAKPSHDEYCATEYADSMRFCGFCVDCTAGPAKALSAHVRVGPSLKPQSLPS